MSVAWTSKLALAAGLAMLPATGWAQSVKISYLTHWSPETVALLEAAAKDYAKTNPDVSVTVRAVPFGDLLTTLRSQGGSSDGPTIGGIYDLWLPELAHDKLVAPAPEAVAGEVKGAWPAGVVSAASVEGKLYGIPLYLDAKFMGYNKSLFKKAGIAEPKTFDDLLSACAALKKTGVTPISYGNKEGWPGVHYAGQLLAYNVPQATLEKDFVPATAEYTDPGYVESLKQYKQIIDECSDGSGTNGSSYASALQQFSNGKSAMYYQEIIEFDQSTADGALKREDFGFFKLPVPKDAKGDVKAIEGAPEGYMINAASKNVPLAIDFMRFVTSAENGKILSAPPYGQPSATVGGYSAESMNPTVVDGLKVIADSSYLMPWLDTANPPRVAAAWLSGLQALIGGSMTPEQVMERVKEAAASSK